jgi:hypothetical protein
LGGGRAEDCRVQLPVTRRWELTEMLPTGRLESLDDPETYLDASGVPASG